MKSIHDCLLYGFVDSGYLQGRTPADIAAQLCDGGADIIQLRFKHSSSDEVMQMAESVLPVTRAVGVPLVINDHLDIARKVGAEFCHLGQEDFFDAGHLYVRELAGENLGMGIGLSTHSPAQAERATKAGAAYLGVGPVFPTGTKPSALPVTLRYVEWASMKLDLPWFAIGGITLDNLEEVLAAGARRVCVVSAILNASNITRTCAEFKRRIELWK